MRKHADPRAASPALADTPARADLAALRAQLQRACASLLGKDRARFEQLLARANPQRFDGARFARDLAQAELRAQNSQRLRPQHIDYPDELPVVQARAELLRAIEQNQVIVVCGETGSGKTTQLPKLCLELGRGARGVIGHTQPRRLAARSVAQRIAQELGSPLGALVGYETRFDRRSGDATLVKLMTDGILLAELGRDPLLHAYDTLIIDEAHERSLNIDFLLGWLKRILPQRPDLKVIVTSATLDPERLSRHFNDAPILHVSGRTYPVQIRYQPADDADDVEDAVARAVDSLWRNTPNGDILVFLPGEREIRDCARVLEGRYPRAEVLPLYSRLAASAQDLVFSRAQKPRIVLATNVAETSLTVPGIRYVIDTGTARLNRYAPRTGVQQLQIEAISQAAANQRSGRCGRLGPGICVRLYAEDDFAARAPFTDPEIKRANLAGVILQMAGLGLGRVDAFSWVDAPEGRHIAEAYRVLQTVGAFDERGQLTAMGRELARLPLDPRVARIALAGQRSAVREAVFVLAAALSVPDPHEVPADAQDAARQKHAQWRHKRSDFFSLLLLWQRWQQWRSAHNPRALRKICREHFVSYLRLEEWQQVYRQLHDLLPAAEARAEARNGKTKTAPEWTAESLEADYTLIHQALLTGLIDHIGQKLPEGNEFQGPKGRRFYLHPGSALAKKPPAWVMSAQLAQTSRLFARSNAAIEPQWLEQVAGHLIKRTLLHPTWNVARGEVSATEHISLLGLSLTSRPRHYGSSHPVEAREILIREGLMAGHIHKKPAVLEQNLALLDDIRDKEVRLRRPDLLASDEQLFAFYDARLPADICTVAALRHWLHSAGSQSLALSENDALRPGAVANIDDLFPQQLTVCGVDLTLSYQHEPGADSDGVTFHIPLAQVHALPESAFDWLVPGLLTARIEGLIRTLPNKLRRAFTPAAEFAQAASARLTFMQGELLPQLCTALTAMTGAAVTVEDFDPARLEAHLQPRFELHDAQGNGLGAASSLAALQGRHRGAARTALNQAARHDQMLARWSRQDIKDWDFDELPESVPLASGALAYPALAVEGARVDLKLFESLDAAVTAHQAGARALLIRQIPDRLRDVSKSVRSKIGMLAPAFALDVEALAGDLSQRSANVTLLHEGAPRSREAFQAALEQRGNFSLDVQRRLADVVNWLGRARELRAQVKALGTRWPESLADMAQQLETLFAPGFAAAIPEPQWARIPIYLRAISVRLERLANKPARDGQLTQQLTPLAGKLKTPFQPARWVLEEWRISLFANELRAVGAPSAAKVDAALITPD
ncbi:ATP-dependent RNA helicase HrpA [Sinimarinibacterium sp. NLF-5-8]|uniref:ATP-dependent RNA helicase HrpA n=1 Tax=Sinimarinibacterium sp. NLF-5-8 TaxID=2698684 RepID=UPI00137BF1B4|nr:ATP-dependent RNA helicase HrpA [Sinimarinibacterium sp. NLF-5-8]QHS10627.1 ATP-dependent RNA helicase HrpA [Sinimarinibacterium sp. NLF-5-8]